jgi:hypothetical protein
MTDTPKPPQQPANLSSLHQELLDLAAHSKPVSGDRRQQGPAIVIRGK